MGTQYLKTNLAVVDYAAETQNHLFNLDDLISRLTAPAEKTSFLVFKNNKYITVRTDEEVRRFEKMKSFRQKRAARRGSSHSRGTAVEELPEQIADEAM